MQKEARSPVARCLYHLDLSLKYSGRVGPAAHSGRCLIRVVLIKWFYSANRIKRKNNQREKGLIDTRSDRVYRNDFWTIGKLPIFVFDGDSWNPCRVCKFRSIVLVRSDREKDQRVYPPFETCVCTIAIIVCCSPLPRKADGVLWSFHCTANHVDSIKFISFGWSPMQRIPFKKTGPDV